MRELLVAITGLALLTACDPTKKQDFSCTGPDLGTFPTSDVCAQVRITDAEGAVAGQECDNKGGSWASDPCPSAGAVGYCSIPGNDWFLSETDVKVFVYELIMGDLAQACADNGGDWTWLVE